MTDINSNEPDPTDLDSAQKLALDIRTPTNQHNTFVVSCVFGWILGQRVGNDAELRRALEDVTQAAEASLWAREDNGHV